MGVVTRGPQRPVEAGPKGGFGGDSGDCFGWIPVSMAGTTSKYLDLASEERAARLEGGVVGWRGRARKQRVT